MGREPPAGYRYDRMYGEGPKENTPMQASIMALALPVRNPAALTVKVEDTGMKADLLKPARMREGSMCRKSFACHNSNRNRAVHCRSICMGRGASLPRAVLLLKLQLLLFLLFASCICRWHSRPSVSAPRDNVI